MSIREFFETLKDRAEDISELVKNDMDFYRKMDDDSKNAEKVEKKNLKEEKKDNIREKTIDIVNLINPELGYAVETLHEVEDTASEKINNLFDSIRNPFSKGKKVKSSHDLYVGDHIYIRSGFITHHGIYVGDDEVIHFAPDELGDVCIHTVSLGKFSDGKKILRMSKSDSPIRYSGIEVAERAQSRLYDGEYNLAFNNCENFARWCRWGE